MNIKIIENNNVLNTLSSMLKNNRLAHSFLIFGENGLGKKTLAKYFAMQMLCENENSSNAPCQICRTCKNIIKGIHPDVIWVEHSGLKQGFKVEDVRKICSDAHIYPNNGSRKIYIFSDADNINIQAQNTLLKLIEEPPEFAYFIFTASSKNVFLNTVLSRIISLGVSECSPQSCAEYLSEIAFSPQQIQAATECFHGNIGKCIEYLSDNSSLKKNVEVVRNITDCIVKRDEYGLCCSLSALEGDKPAFKNILLLLNKQFRDAGVMKFSTDFSPIGCYLNGALSLSACIPLSQCEHLQELTENVFIQTEQNVNLKLLLTSYCSEIMQILNM